MAGESRRREQEKRLLREDMARGVKEIAQIGLLSYADKRREGKTEWEGWERDLSEGSDTALQVVQEEEETSPMQRRALHLWVQSAEKWGQDRKRRS